MAEHRTPIGDKIYDDYKNTTLDGEKFCDCFDALMMNFDKALKVSKELTQFDNNKEQ